MKPSRKSDKKPEASGPPTVGNLFPVVGIGASAGGLEPLEEIFSHLAEDVEMSVIVLVHSDPAHETLLPEILSRRTKFGVHKAKDGVSPQAKCLYVCPSDSILTMERGRIHLTPRSKLRSQVLPIDQFFSSLAAELENRAVGVVLSGTGSDGTLGLQEIKMKGGITFAQDEKSAKFYSMPQNAISTGAVDFVLSPKEIALQLARVARHEYVRSVPRPISAVRSPVIPEKTEDAIFVDILAHIHRVSGIDFSQYKHGTVSRRILRRMALHNISKVSDFRKFLIENPKVAQQVAQDILIQVTKFFREPEAFDLLKTKVFPCVVDKRSREEPIRVWVPGCSSGEEVYSVLIALSEFLEEGNHRFPIQFFGTDLSEGAIAKSRAATYGETIEQDVSPERLRRFFTRAGAGYEINKSLRDLCIFAKHNVVTDPPFGKLDLVTCRNLLIYLEVPLQVRALSIFHYALKPKGILILGDAETVGGVSDFYTALDSRHRVYTKKPISSRLFFDFVGAQQTADKISSGPSAASALGESASKGIQMQRDADRYLMTEFIPPGVLVNEQLELVQFRGKTGPFFEPSPGFASLDLLSMLKAELVPEVKSALEAARKKAPVRIEDIRVKLNGDLKRIALEVIPMSLPLTGERYFILLFEDMDLPVFKEFQRRREIRKALPQDAEDGKALSAVRAELVATKDFMQALKEEKEASNEELRAANEEIVSSNEELQSTNEELHSAKEELQSTNEELLTVNDELKIRNQDLSLLNDDLSNLFNSFDSAMILLTNDLRVRRYTPVAGTLFRLLPGDVGRSIADIRANVEIKDMEKLLLEVITTAVSKTMEVQDGQGSWYAVQMKPYRTEGGRIDGGVLIFTDITQLKTSLIYSEAVESIYAHPLLVLGGDLKIKRANSKFYEVFKVTPAETENRFIYDLGNRQWNIPSLRELLEKVLPQNSDIANYEVTHQFPGIGKKTMILNARRLFYQTSATETILLAIDVIE